MSQSFTNNMSHKIQIHFLSSHQLHADFLFFIFSGHSQVSFRSPADVPRLAVLPIFFHLLVMLGVCHLQLGKPTFSLGSSPHQRTSLGRTALQGQCDNCSMWKKHQQLKTSLALGVYVLYFGVPQNQRQQNSEVASLIFHLFPIAQFQCCQYILFWILQFCFNDRIKDSQNYKVML